MLSIAVAMHPVVVFVSPKKATASGLASLRTGYSFAIIFEEISASVSPSQPSSISGFLKLNSLKKIPLRLSE